MPRSSALKRKRNKSTPKRVNKKKTAEARNKLKKAFILTTVFFVSLSFLGGYTFFKKLTQEYASAFSSVSKEPLSPELYSVLLLSVEDFDKEPLVVKKVDLLIYDKDTLKLIPFNIPSNISVDAPGRFGIEPVSNILALGMLEFDDLEKSIDLVTSSVVKLMAFPVDRYVLYEEEAGSTVEDFFRGRIKLNSDRENIFELKDHLKTDLSPKELFDTYSFAVSLPKDRVVEKQLSSTYLDNPGVLDEEFLDLTFDSLISREKKSIAILNGTSIPGVASYGSRLVKNIGGRIVAVGNTNNDYENSVIITDDPTTESTRIMQRIFRIDNVVSGYESREYRESEIDRSDITIIFGLDFAKSL